MWLKVGKIDINSWSISSVKGSLSGQITLVINDYKSYSEPLFNEGLIILEGIEYYIDSFHFEPAFDRITLYGTRKANIDLSFLEAHPDKLEIKQKLLDLFANHNIEIKL